MSDRRKISTVKILKWKLLFHCSCKTTEINSIDLSYYLMKKKILEGMQILLTIEKNVYD